MPRIALIHALVHSIAPIAEAFARLWPEARLHNLLDDSLAADLAGSGGALDAAMHHRFESLAAYAEATGARAILFTCSAFGPCIAAAAARRPHLPVLSPYAGMIEEAAALGGPVGLIASFAPTLATLPAEFPATLTVVPRLAEGALAALDAGDPLRHDRLVVEAAEALVAAGCRVIALAQFSLARAAPAVAGRLGVPVLTTPDAAVRALRRRLAQATATPSSP